MKTQTLKIAILFGVPWILIMIIVNTLMNGGFTIRILASTVFGGVFGGITFAFVMTYLSKRLYNKTVVEIADGEKLIKEGAANHFKGAEGVGGKLVLTDKRLIFKSHKFNIQNHEDNFQLQQIKMTQATKTLGLFNNGLMLQLLNNDKHRFAVDNSHDWAEVIQREKNAVHETQ